MNGCNFYLTNIDNYGILDKYYKFYAVRHYKEKVVVPVYCLDLDPMTGRIVDIVV